MDILIVYHVPGTSQIWRIVQQKGACGCYHYGAQGPVGHTGRWGEIVMNTRVRQAFVKLQNWGAMNPDSKRLGMGYV